MEAKEPLVLGLAIVDVFGYPKAFPESEVERGTSFGGRSGACTCGELLDPLCVLLGPD